MSTPDTIVGFCWLGICAYWVISAVSAKKDARPQVWRVRTGLRIRLALLIAVIVLIRVAAIRHYGGILRRTHTPDALVESIGVIACIAGVAFAAWARAYIGRNWGMPMSLREGHELVTSGPYAYVRHPIYSGLLLAMLGSGIATGAGWLLLFIACLAYFVYAARVEERDMTQQFPDAYPAYQRRTKMLIPFVL